MKCSSLKFVTIVGLGMIGTPYGCKQVDATSAVKQVTSTDAGTSTGCVINGASFDADQCSDYDRIESCFQRNCGSRLSEQCVSDAGGNPDKGIYGGGWGGNWFGQAKCNEVHDAMSQLMDKCLATGLKSADIRPCSILRSFPQHIYFGVCQGPTVIAWADPWRYTHCTLYKPGTGSHSTSHSTVPWVVRRAVND